jgi:hypothetical protein
MGTFCHMVFRHIDEIQPVLLHAFLDTFLMSNLLRSKCGLFWSPDFGHIYVVNSAVTSNVDVLSHMMFGHIYEV